MISRSSYCSVELKCLNHQPVTVVECNLLHQDEHYQFQHYPVKRRQLGAKVAATPDHDVSHDIHKRDADHNLVECHSLQTTDELLTVNL